MIGQNRMSISLLVAVSVLAMLQVPAAEAQGADQQVPPEIEPIRAPFAMPRLTRPTFPDQTFNIAQYGAIGDGKTKNTEAFRKAIVACSAAGGGRVLVPKGRWLTGPIHLKSNVNLHFQEGAEIHFSDKFEDYLPVVFTRWEGQELYNYSPLIYARDCENIAITGPGKLFGHGRAWWPWKKRGSKTALRMYKEQVLKGVPPEKRIYGTPEAGLRPPMISPTHCKNVLFEGFSVLDPGPFWTFHILYCENIIVRNLRIQTHGGPNADGINLISSRYALIEHCTVDAGDDCVTLKSGLNEDGWRVGRPTENVVVRYIKGLRCHGGITIGSEMSGGVRNVLAHDCNFLGSDVGIRLKSNVARGGAVENIWYRDIKMGRIRKMAISVDLQYGSFIIKGAPIAAPLFRNITIENVTCKGARVAASVVGNHHKPLENFTLKNVSIKADVGMKFAWVNGLTLENVECKPKKGKPITLDHCKNVVVEPAEAD